MEERVKQNLIRLGVKPGSSVGAAVSGGTDSMALLNCLCNLRSGMDIIITAYHMEHGIRGESSVRDMEFVAKRCEALGVKCITLRADVPALAKEQGISIEAAARRLRYEFLDTAQADFIATAHHMEDNAETVLMNLARGSGLAGLCGIPERRGKYIRPMLDISKRDIEEYIEINGIEHITDETNDDTSYTRNYIRKEIIPRLKRVNEAAAANIQRTAALLAEDEEALISAANKSGCLEKTDEGVYIDLGRLGGLKSAVKKRVIRLAVQQAGGLEDLEFVNMQDILALAEKAETAKRINLAHGMFAAVVYGKLMIGKNSEKRYNNNLVVLETGIVRFGDMVFECSCYEGSPVFEEGAEYFDTKAVRGAVFRHRRQGDFISPLGMDGTKRLCDYLSDRKVPLHKRDSLVLLTKGSEVLWAAGVGVSETSKVKTGKAALRITYAGDGECITT